MSGTAEDLTVLLREAVEAVGLPITGVVSDGQPAIGKAVALVLPDVPHQLCHFHVLREAALPIFEADRHAKKERKKGVRGVRPIERAVQGRSDPEAELVRGYAAAVRSAITGDGRAARCTGAAAEGTAGEGCRQPGAGAHKTGRRVHSRGSCS